MVNYIFLIFSIYLYFMEVYVFFGINYIKNKYIKNIIFIIF